MDLRNFLKNQIKKGKINWESRSVLIRAAQEKVNGYTFRVLKEHENKFHFGSIIKIKNKAIKNYFYKQPKNSLISVEGAVKIINENLPKDMQISETIIYNRLADKEFNNRNLKGQKLNNQISKTKNYDVDLSENFLSKIEKINLKSKKIFLNIEDTQAGNKCLRLKIYNFSKSQNSKSKDKMIIAGTKINTTYPPNDDSLIKINKIIESYV